MATKTGAELLLGHDQLYDKDANPETKPLPDAFEELWILRQQLHHDPSLAVVVELLATGLQKRSVRLNPL